MAFGWSPVGRYSLVIRKGGTPSVLPGCPGKPSPNRTHVRNFWSRLRHGCHDEFTHRNGRVTRVTKGSRTRPSAWRDAASRATGNDEPRPAEDSARRAKLPRARPGDSAA